MCSWSAYSVPGPRPGSWIPAVMNMQSWSQESVMIQQLEEGNSGLSETSYQLILSETLGGRCCSYRQKRERGGKEAGTPRAPPSRRWGMWAWPARSPSPVPPLRGGHLVLPLPLSVVLAYIFHLLQCHWPCLHLCVDHGHRQQVHLGSLWGYICFLLWG